MADKWAVLGAGAWGTALAEILAHNGKSVMLWDRDPAITDDIEISHQNRKCYPDLPLHAEITATSNLGEAVKQSDIILIAVSSDANTSLAAQISPYTNAKQGLVIASKGLRESDGALLSELWREAIPQITDVAIIAGPTFAREVMERKITAMLIASVDDAFRTRVAESFDTPWLRVYQNDDIIGAQVGGAVKNVLAIAAGILDGLEMGYNARAAMLTRGLVEMGRFSKALGGKDQTIWGLAGMGDLLLTATSSMSRNFRFGQLVGRGTPIHEAKLRIGTVEGLLAARIITVQAQSLGLDLAINSAIDGILHGDVTPLHAIEYLMQRPRVTEF